MDEQKTRGTFKKTLDTLIMATHNLNVITSEIMSMYNEMTDPQKLVTEGKLQEWLNSTLNCLNEQKSQIQEGWNFVKQQTVVGNSDLMKSSQQNVIDPDDIKLLTNTEEGVFNLFTLKSNDEDSFIDLSGVFPN